MELKKITPVQMIMHLVPAPLAPVFVYSFLWMLSASSKTQSEFFESGLNLIPEFFKFDNFVRARNNVNFAVYLRNFIIVTLSAVAIVLMATSLADYVLGRYASPGKKLITGISLASTMISLVLTITPVYELLKNIGLSQNLLGLILAESGGDHVIFLMLFFSHYQIIPKEMEEAATIDGTGFLQAYMKVIFPLAKSIMVTVVIIQSIWAWNSFLLPLIVILNNPKIRTLAVGPYALRGENVVDQTGIAADASIAIVPVVIIFIALQKYFVDSIAGAVKSQ